MNIKYLNSLSPVEKVLYKTSFNFQKKLGKSDEVAHEKSVKSVNDTMGISSSDEVIDYVDVFTGEKFSCTENEMMARNA